jgi:hypothetical protein
MLLSTVDIYNILTVNYRARLKKFKVNYNHYFYNSKTSQYESKEGAYTTYNQARANQWKCEKCHALFGSIKGLKLHKNNEHSY